MQRSFARGEIAPALYARVDQNLYAISLRTCRNFLIQKHGGAYNRPGTRFIGEVKFSDLATAFVKFIFNDDQTYLLEFGHEYVRFYHDGERVFENGLNVTAGGVTQGLPALVNLTAHGYEDGNWVRITGVVGMTQLNNREFVVGDVTANTFKLYYPGGASVDSTVFGAYVSGGVVERVYEIDTEYDEADVRDIKYTQSADVVRLVHPDYPINKLSRIFDTDWELEEISTEPSIQAPIEPSNNGGSGGAASWRVTSIADKTFEESLPSELTESASTPSPGNTIVVSWPGVDGAIEYNVYRKKNGIYGFIGTAAETLFNDNGITPDTLDSPPKISTPFLEDGDRPATVCHYQGRVIYAGSFNEPETVKASRTDLYDNFSESFPLQSDDPVTFTIGGQKVNRIVHLIDLGLLIIGTSSGIHRVDGDEAGVLRPYNINQRQQVHHGMSKVTPIVVNNTVLYIEARGSIMRDLAYDFQSDGYQGNELSVFASHLFRGKVVTSMDYQLTPDSLVWITFDDGSMACLTYIREHAMLAWHRHDFNGEGTTEWVSVIPEGNRDVTYFLVKREVDGREVKYVEALTSREAILEADYVFLDCSKTYDGRNVDESKTVNLSDETGWTKDDTQLLTFVGTVVDSTYVGKQIHVEKDGALLRLTVLAAPSSSTLQVQATRDVPASFQDVTTSSWGLAIFTVTDLWHLEGKDVGISGDAYVVASPLNTRYSLKTVENGQVTMDNAHVVVHVGLPIVSDLETLDIDSEGESKIEDKKHTNRATAMFELTRSVWHGTQAPAGSNYLDKLRETKTRRNENLDLPTSLTTGKVMTFLNATVNTHGRLFVRQVDPVPVGVLAILPGGEENI